MRLDHITPKQTVMQHSQNRRITTIYARPETGRTASLPGGHSERVPPEPIPNSEVKTLSADDSAGSPRVKVGHCQAYKLPPSALKCRGFYFIGGIELGLRIFWEFCEL